MTTARYRGQPLSRVCIEAGLQVLPVGSVVSELGSRSSYQYNVEQHERFAKAILQAALSGPCPWCRCRHGHPDQSGVTPDCGIVLEARAAVERARKGAL